MSAASCIAIDVMGGDYGPPVTVPAALKALRRHPGLRLYLVGDQHRIAPFLQGAAADERQRLELLHTEMIISNQARPDSILRSHRESSMYHAVDLVRKGAANACVSAGNTGALLLAGRHLLKTIPGIDRPAIIATLPATRSGGYTYLLDVGANTHCSASELFQYALMGAVLASSLTEKIRPRVALLNIGEEAYKGTPVIRETSALLSESPDIDYVGFVEGNQLFDGKADVIVCDGFTGNITIKTSAGAVEVLHRVMRRGLSRRWYYRLFGWAVSPLLKDLFQELKPSRYNGATLVGLQGIIVKSHGNAQQDGFERAIEHALYQIADDVPRLIQARMSSLAPVSDGPPISTLH